FGHAAVADFQHVGIIPMTGLGPGREIVLAKSNSRHRIPSVTNVAGCAPEITTNISAPLPNVEATVLAKTVNDGAFGCSQGVAHFLIDGRHLFVGVKRA